MLETVTLDLDDFAAQQAVKEYLIRKGAGGWPSTITDPALAEIQREYKHMAVERILVAWDGERGASVAAAGSFNLDAEIDAVGVNGLWASLFSPEDIKGEAGLYVLDGKLIWQDGPWDCPQDGQMEWHSISVRRASVVDLDAMGIMIEECFVMLDEEDIDEAKFSAAVSTQFPTSLVPFATSPYSYSPI